MFTHTHSHMCNTHMHTHTHTYIYTHVYPHTCVHCYHKPSCCSFYLRTINFLLYVIFLYTCGTRLPLQQNHLLHSKYWATPQFSKLVSVFCLSFTHLCLFLSLSLQFSLSTHHTTLPGYLFYSLCLYTTLTMSNLY